MVMTLSRNEYLEDYYAYSPGESAVFIGPTGTGKTVFAQQCLDEAMRQNPRLSVSTAMPKPADDQTVDWAGRSDFKITDHWPAERYFWQHKPRGYIHWPKHIRGDEDKNEDHLRNAFKRQLSDEFWRGESLVFLDDSYRISCGLKCGKYVDKTLTEGRANGAGVFAVLQQPKGTVSTGSVSGFHYSQPSKLFLYRDGTESNRERYTEIAMGLDPRIIDSAVLDLKTYRINNCNVSDVLVLDRAGPYMCVVTPF